jgi:hypothetical protein
VSIPGSVELPTVFEDEAALIRVDDIASAMT